VILRARARRHAVRDFPGPLSIKSVVEGTVRWKTGGREISVDEGSFLILNDGEPYSMNIDSPAPVETCCVFFEPGFVERIHGALVSPPLDEPCGRPAEFAARLHPCDGRILPRMRAVRAMESPLSIEEQFLLLARDLLLLREETRRQIGRLPSP